MQTYEISAENRVKLKRRMSILLGVNYFVIIALFSFALMASPAIDPHHFLMTIFTVVIILTYIYNIRRYSEQADKTKLVVEKTAIKLQIPKRAEEMIRLDNIADVKEKKSGLLLTSKSSAKQTFFISNGFENFDEIEKLVKSKADKQE
ncbi:MAG TPA: hypothetical protein VHA56_11985 [Mucilaginibacter sp.]|nr:hypothetical protein [Mucilaginibacter sp.]